VRENNARKLLSHLSEGNERAPAGAAKQYACCELNGLKPGACPGRGPLKCGQRVYLISSCLSWLSASKNAFITRTKALAA
jgi:hypothetical protein